MFAGVGDAKARDEAQLDRLLGNRECTRNDRLAGDDRCHGREDNQRQAQRFRGKEEEGILDGLQRVGRGFATGASRPAPCN